MMVYGKQCDRDGAARWAARAGLFIGTALVVIALLTAAASAATYNTWVSQTSGTTGALYGVAFVTADQGWAVGASGTIRHTSNGGATWGAQTSGASQNLRDVVFTDADNGWIVGDGGTILCTSNGGGKWSKQSSGTTNALYAVFMLDDQKGWAVGARGVVLTTANGGAQWTLQTSQTTQALQGVWFTDATHGWAGGAKGTQLSTTSGGTSWSLQSLGKKVALNGILFADANTGWEVGSNGLVRHTSSAGSSWTGLNSGTRTALYGIAADTAGDAWVVGSGGVVRFSSDNGGTWVAQASGTTVSLRAVARVGRNLYAVGDGGTIIASIADVTPPVTTATGLQADNHSGWTNTGATVTLTATDTRSGVAATYYSLSGGTAQTYAVPVEVTQAGQNLVRYWSEDRAGNVEDEQSGWVNVDKTSPTVGDDADSTWHNSDVTVHLSPADAGGSGLAVTEYRLQGAPDWSSAEGDSFTVAAPSSGANDGAHVYEYRAVDGAGNASTTGACTVQIDATAAQTTADGLFDELTGWSQSGRTVTLTAGDDLSGVVATYYTVDGGGDHLYTAPFNVVGNAQHPVTYWSVDGAGNIESLHTGWVNIAQLFAEATGLAPTTTTHWRNTGANVTITGGGENAPFTITYQIDDGEWTTVSSPASFSVDGVGNHTVVYYAKDHYGSESGQLTGHVNIETTPPVTTALSVPTGWRNTDIVVPLQATDDLSGAAGTFYRIGTGGWIPATQATVPAPPDHSMDGARTVSYYSVDAAGNQEAAKSFAVHIDTRRPSTRAPYAASVVRNHYATLKCKILDAKPCASKATLKLVVKNGRGVVKWQHVYTSVRVNRLVSERFFCKLSPGTYRFFVYATDRAGNTQSKVGSNRLTVL